MTEVLLSLANRGYEVLFRRFDMNETILIKIRKETRWLVKSFYYGLYANDYARIEEEIRRRLLDMAAELEKGE